MDKNFSSKVVNFLKKEGFYVILFVCLCVVAVAAVVTVKDNKRSDNSAVKQSSVSQNDKLSRQAANSEGKSSLNYDNALQVKKGTKSGTVSSKNNTSQSVSNPVKTSFAKPVNGILARGYSEDPVYWDSTASYRPNLGYDIKCNLGTPVMAAMSGKVTEVNNSTQDGVEVIIDHQNGLKTVYSNLDSKVRVTKGQNITAGTVIGTVGKTTLRSAYEKYGDHLHFAVLNGNNFVDPARYVKY